MAIGTHALYVLKVFTTTVKQCLSNTLNVLAELLQACMWGELVDDCVIDGRVWPRAAAVGERLWSDPEEGTAAAEARMYRHRERLVSRGIKAEGLAPQFCYQDERHC